MGKYAKTAFLIAGFAGSVAFGGNHWYVDAVNGDDRWNGQASFSGVVQTDDVGPKKTFSKLFADCRIDNGDIVHAAAGTYSNLTMTATTGVKGEYRVIVPAGVTVVADEGPDKTIIMGKAADGVSLTESPFGCGEGAVRCVQLKGNGAVIKGFTLTGGHSTDYEDPGYVGAVDGSSADSRQTFVVGCIITNNVGARAAGVYESMAVRCIFAKNRVWKTGCDVWLGGAFNCVFGDCFNSSSYNVNVYGGSKYAYVNNVFYGNGSCTHAASGSSLTLYNSIVLKEPTANNIHFTNCIVSVSKGFLGEGSEKVEDVKLDEGFRPLRDSPCMDSGNASYYNDNFPVALINEKSFDCGMNCRITGDTIDVGAYESPFTRDEAFDWYVDSAKGSDENDGYSPQTPFCNLAKALTNSYLRAGDIVHAAPGVYSNGVVFSKWNFRAVVPDGVALVGDKGANETFIIGEFDKNTDLENKPYGCGEGAVRCVRLGEGSSLRGFTVTGGFSTLDDASNNVGGGVYCGDNNRNAKQYGIVLNCIITNNCAYYGAGAFGGKFYGCLFSDNRAITANRACDIHIGEAYNCLLGDALGTCNYIGSKAVNCTFYGTGSASNQSGDSYAENIMNSVLLKGGGRNVRLINSVTTSSTSTLGDGSFLLGQEEMMIDECFRPQKGSPLVDKGNVELYKIYFTQDNSVNGDKDILGGQRIYNGKIDLGAFEYDWRNDFSAIIGKKNLIVVDAGENAVTNGSHALLLNPGGSIVVDWMLEEQGTYVFNVISRGDGVSVLRDGEEMSVDSDGVCGFSHVGGAVKTRIVIVCDASSTAEIGLFRKFKGMIILVR